MMSRRVALIIQDSCSRQLRKILNQKRDNIYPTTKATAATTTHISSNSVSASQQLSSTTTIDQSQSPSSALKEECLRIDVDNGGCSGFSYVFKIEQTIDDKEDVVIEKDGCKVVVNKNVLPYIEGSSIEYNESLIKSSFRIVNPNAEQKCSCGSSFSVDIDKITSQQKPTQPNETKNNAS